MSFDSGGSGAAPSTSPLLTRRNFIVGASALGVGIAAYATTHGRHQLEVTRQSFAVRELPDAFVGFRIIQISDIHLEEYTEAWFLEHVVAQVNALKPDLVLLTGDFVSRGPRSTAYSWKCAGICAEILSGLKAPERYAIVGNHEQSVGPEHVIQPLEAHGTPFLVDKYVSIDRGHDRIWVGGTDDATKKPDLNLSVPADLRAPLILMCHEPDYADTLAENPRFAKVDIMLSGHSHGGQIRIPGIGPLLLPPLGRKYVAGRYQLGHTQLYVNRGIGTVGLPFRFYCPAEITELTLTRA
jgi:predicted MPP superfamily phosphohydrolase